MIDFILDDFCWSFSRLESFDRCPKCFYLQYIEKLKGIDGVFGQYGSLCHDILEKYAKKELFEFELSDYYKDNFDNKVAGTFPKIIKGNLRQKYYEDGLNYFENFQGFGNKNILSIEDTYYFKIGKYNFTGKIDLEISEKVLDLETFDEKLNLEIIDHKTKKSQHLLRLTKKHNKEDYIEMIDGRYIKFDNFIQLYVYSIPFYNKYNKYPDVLSLNMLKINDWYSIKFDKNQFDKSIYWILGKIEEIYKTENFIKGNGVDSFWCDNTCGQRYNCNYSNRFTEMGG